MRIRSSQKQQSDESEAGYWELKAWFEKPLTDEEVRDTEARRSEWREFFGEELADLLLGRRFSS